MKAVDDGESTLTTKSGRRWRIRDSSGSIIGHAASRETANYLESSMRAVEVRVINHA